MAAISEHGTWRTLSSKYHYNEGLQQTKRIQEMKFITTRRLGHHSVNIKVEYINRSQMDIEIKLYEDVSQIHVEANL